MVAPNAMTGLFLDAPRWHDVIGTWGAPPDGPATVALVSAVLAGVAAAAARGAFILGLGKHAVSRRAFLAGSALAAALLSAGYIFFYLRGGPRIIDATTYFLQGRALSQGAFHWSIPEPGSSFRGRFLISPDGGTSIGGIFPPGYPLVLAMGFRLGSPMVIGPLLAAGLVVATYFLARTLANEAHQGGAIDHAEPIARTAALISVVCAALRYQTADTMSHAATATFLVLAVLAATRGRALVTGLMLGAVFATRPVSAVAPLFAAVFLVARHGDGPHRTARALALLVCGALPGCAFFFVAQHAVTGAWFTSSQKVYYALSDGPPGCFRWGFGKGIGCLFEHGEFVHANLREGYGAIAAIGTTLRRLRLHLLDIGNVEPLSLLCLAPLFRRRMQGTSRPLANALYGLVFGHMAAYAGFYFDGNYPGGGARLFAELLPLEHGLLALALARIASEKTLVRAALGGLSCMLAGFAVHASFEHEKLAQRDGGRPMFEPDVLSRANITHGLLFVDTDHGFALGHDPSANANEGIVVARLRNDDRDRILFEQLGRPNAFRYVFSPEGRTAPHVVPWSASISGATHRLEAENEWPVIHQKNGFALPVYGPSCLSESRALALTPIPYSTTATATLTVPVTITGRYWVTVRIVHDAHIPYAAASESAARNGSFTLARTRWDWHDDGSSTCQELERREASLEAPFETAVLEATGGTIAIDRIIVEPMSE
jgi:hypothetical protein